VKNRKTIVALGAVLNEGEKMNLAVANKVKDQLPSIAEEINRKRTTNAASGLVELTFFPKKKNSYCLSAKFSATNSHYL